MASNSVPESAAKGFAVRGRTLTGTHFVDLAHASAPALVQLAAANPGVTHLDVIVAKGSFGSEVLIVPSTDDRVLPGELYAQVPGAFGAPSAYATGDGQGLCWTSPSADLQNYLRTHQFGAPDLPGGQREGQHEINLDWTVQLSALSADKSIVVCQLSSVEPLVVAAALVTIDRLAKSTTQSRAGERHGMLHPLRFGAIVEMALSGALETPPPPPPPAAAPSAAEPPPPPPAASTPPPPAPPPPAPMQPAPMPPPPAPRSASTIDSSPTPPAPRAVAVENELPTEAHTPDSFDMSASLQESSAPSSGITDASAAVTEALRRYEGKRVAIGELTDQKKLANVLRGISPGVQPEEICGFVDTGARANGKSGAVFTATAVHFSGRQQFQYDAIESFALEGAAVVINGTDGRRLKLSTSGQELAIAEAVAAATGLTV